MNDRWHVDVIDTLEQLGGLERNWASVYDLDPEAQYFLSWPWMSAWLRLLRRPWLVLAARPCPLGPYSAFVPLQLCTHMSRAGVFANGLRMAGHYLSSYTGFLCAPAGAADAMTAFAAHIAGMSWATLHLDTVANSAERLAPFTDHLAGRGLVIRKYSRSDPADSNNYSIYPYISLPDNFDSFLAGNLGKSTRKNARADLRLLAGSDVRITHADAETIHRDVAVLMGFWRTQWLPVKGDATTRQEAELHRAMLHACFADGSVLLTVLWREDRPLAACASLLDRKHRALRSLVGGRDLSVGRPSPLFLLDLHCIRWAIENGYATYDFLQGDHAYKYAYGPQERRLDSQVIATADGRNLHDRLEPRSLPAALAGVQALCKAGRPTEAAAGCRQILEVEPGHPGARGVLARLAAADATPSDPMARARNLARDGDFRTAAEVLRRLLAAEPKRFDARHMLGVILLRQRRYEEAERNLRLAASLAPSIAVAHYHHGIALVRTGRTVKALKSFDRAIALQADYADAQAQRAGLLKVLGRVE